MRSPVARSSVQKRCPSSHTRRRATWRSPVVRLVRSMRVSRAQTVHFTQHHPRRTTDRGSVRYRSRSED